MTATQLSPLTALQKSIKRINGVIYFGVFTLSVAAILAFRAGYVPMDITVSRTPLFFLGLGLLALSIGAFIVFAIHF